MQSSMIQGSFYALLAGFLGAAASLSAKLSLGADYVRDLCLSWTQTQHGAMYCDGVRQRAIVFSFVSPFILV